MRNIESTLRPVLRAVCPGQTHSFIWAAIEWLSYDREALVRECVIGPRSLVAGRDVYDQDVEDLSE